MRRFFLCVACCWLGCTRLAAADIFRILNGEREALQCRFDLMEQARKEVLLAMFIIKDDLIGRASLASLQRAAARGVKVRVILDDQGNRLPTDLLLYMEKQGVEVRIFNIKRWTNPRSVVDRMHSKMLITDARQLIVGGRNLKEEYFELDQAINFLDREVYVEGELALQLGRTHFYEMWNHPHLTARKDDDTLTQAEYRYWEMAVGQAPELVQQCLNLNLEPGIDWAAGMTPTRAPVQLEFDSFTRRFGRKYVRYNRKDDHCTRELLAMVNAAHTSIDIENAYFMPTRRWWRALKAARKRGVYIRVLTNSDYTSDVPLVQSVYRYKRRKYLRAGLELWEYRGEKMLHTKAMTVDGRYVMIGSYNLDNKSERYNTEVMAWVDEPRIALEQLGIMNRVLEKSVRVGDPASENRADLFNPTHIMKKRKKRVDFFRWTLAPIADWVF